MELSADGVFRCEPGMAILHPPFHQHANRFLHPEVWVTNVVVPTLAEYRVLRLSPHEAREVRRVSRAAELLELLASCDSVGPDEPPPPVLAAAEVLRSRPHRRIGEVASDVGLSPEHLARLFKRHTGMKPTTFRSEQRLRGALADLGRDVPASIAAQRWAYSDQSHLCRAVKAATGQTIGDLKRSGFFKTGTTRLP